jgi:hypothetical protein
MSRHGTRIKEIDALVDKLGERFWEAIRLFSVEYPAGAVPDQAIVDAATQFNMSPEVLRYALRRETPMPEWKDLTLEQRAAFVWSDTFDVCFDDLIVLAKHAGRF